MALLKSLLYFIKESNYNPISLSHSMLYIGTQTYLRVFDKLLKYDFNWLRNHMAETYHGKVVRLEDASKFITINRNIELKNLEKIVPYKYAKDIILRNPHNIVLSQCPCRAQKKDACQPTDVCLVVGEPFVDLCKTFRFFCTRKITPEEALKVLQEEHARGHMHTVWFKDAMLNRFYSICNCCSCCCLGMKFMSEYKMRTISPSGYRAEIGGDCAGCGKCAENCQFKAIEMRNVRDNGNEKKIAVGNKELCYGCGVCEDKCKKGNINLVLDPDKGLPLDIISLEEETREKESRIN